MDSFDNSVDNYESSSLISSADHDVGAEEILKIVKRLRHLVECLIPKEISITNITNPERSIITSSIVDLAINSVKDDTESTTVTTNDINNENDRSFDKSACIVFALLVCCKWYKELEDASTLTSNLSHIRFIACQVIASRIIDLEEDKEFLFKSVLCKRYFMFRNGKLENSTNAFELSVDLHALIVISSNGYQNCIQRLWDGHIIQSDKNPMEYVTWKKFHSLKFWQHFDPERLRAPIYQNAFQLFISIIFLILYTIAINTENSRSNLDFVEVLLYVLTLGYIFEEISKIYKIGWKYIGIYSVINDLLYIMFIISFIIRLIAISIKNPYSETRLKFHLLSYYILSASSPLVWLRLLLFLDFNQFFGNMIIVVTRMMRESILFFILLLIVCVGFLQAFIGLDYADGAGEVVFIVLGVMTRTILGDSSFGMFENFAKPFGITLYYFFTFLVSIILVNILVALYNSAYQDIVDNSVNEYLALKAHKTLRFIRAPDENVYIPPFNLIEIFCLILPFEWWMDPITYNKINDIIMTVIYAPMLILISWYEVRKAKNRSHQSMLIDDLSNDLRFEQKISIQTAFDSWKEFSSPDQDCYGASSKWKKDVYDLQQRNNFHYIRRGFHVS